MVVKNVKFGVGNFKRKMDKIGAFKSNLFSIGTKEARISF
jgi:hypothetical protein